MKIKILCSILLILLAVACTTMSENQVDDLKEKIMKANMDVSSFKFKSIGNIQVEGKNESISMKMDTVGSFDRDAKKFMVKGTIDMAEMQMPIETYSDGEWIYTNTMGQWLKMRVISPEMFEMQDQAKYLNEFLESSEIKAEETIIDGKNYYKIDIKPDSEALLDLAQKNSPIPLEDLGELKDMFKNIEIIYFVNKESFIADKVDMKYELTLKDVFMKMDSKYEMFDINKPQEIVIPAEAKDAVDFSELQQQMMQAQQGSLETDVIEE